MATAAASLPENDSAPHLDLKIGGRDDDGLPAFAAVRARLFGIAYRMLRSAAAAEDIVQDVWLRWQATNRIAVQNPPAFLATTTTRLCINLSQAAHSRRESYPDGSLPEPMATGSDPGTSAERREALRFAVLELLERLSPAERAAYVLHEAFDYSYAEIADILQMEEANTRQVVSRARKRIAGRRRATASPGEQQRLLDALIAATQQGDMARLESLLAENVVSSSAAGWSTRRGSRPKLWRRCSEFAAA